MQPFADISLPLTLAFVTVSHLLTSYPVYKFSLQTSAMSPHPASLGKFANSDPLHNRTSVDICWYLTRESAMAPLISHASLTHPLCERHTAEWHGGVNDIEAGPLLSSALVLY